MLVEDVSDTVEASINVPNERMKEKAEMNIKEEVKNSMESMLSPLITYMRLLGFTNTTNNSRLQKPLLIYNILVIICLVSEVKLFLSGY